MSINSIKELFFEGEFNRALDLIEKLPIKDKIRGAVYKSGILLAKGQYQQYFQLIDEIIEKRKQENDRFVILGSHFFKHLTVDYLTIARWLKIPIIAEDRESPLGETSNLIQLYEHFNDEQTQEWIALLYCHQSWMEMLHPDFDRSLKSVNNALAIGKKIKSPIAKCIALIQLGEHYSLTGDKSLGFEYTQQAFTLARKSNLKLLHCALYRKLGEMMIRRGDLSKASEYLSEGMALSKEMAYENMVESITISLKNLYFKKGDYDSSLELLSKIYNVAKEKQLEWELRTVYLEFGRIYRLKGDLTKSLDYFQKGMVQAKKLDYKYGQASAYRHIGEVYYDQGAFQEALETFQKAYQIYGQISGGFPSKGWYSLIQASSLYALILVNIELNNIEQAKLYLKNLKETSKLPVSYILSPRERKKGEDLLIYKLSKGLILKASKRMRDKVKALEIFEGISKQENISLNNLSFALFNICDLLLYEYRSSGEKEIFNEIKEITERLYNLGKEKNIPPLTIKSMIILSKLNLIEGQLEDVARILEEAKQIAKDYKLNFLLNHVEKEQNNVKSELEKWKSLLKRNAPVSERLEKADLENYVRSALRIVSTFQEDIQG
ncbi:MAG: tetratricopeptide repeat protein [Candidatus Hodarchaeales archaeon]